MSSTLSVCFAAVEIIKQKRRRVYLGEFEYSCEVWGFRSCVACSSFLLKCDAASLGNLYPTFRGKVVALKSQQWLTQ
jgi:hypothetical protein